MTAERLPLWARMACGYDDDPKVSALARFGEEAGLCRDLHLAMIRYGRRNETDGWVPDEEIGRLAWPLPVDRAMALIEHLAEVRLISKADAMAGAMTPAMADAMAGVMASGWQVANYSKWQETRGEVAAYSAAQAARGRRGAEMRWKREPARRASTSGGMAPAERVLDGQARWRPDGEPMAEVEREQEQESSGSGRDAGAGARAREGQPEEDDRDDEELSQVPALMAAAGRPVSREDAATIRATVLAKAGTVRNPRAFIGKVLGDPKQARGYAPGAAPHAPTAREIVEQAHRPGGPGDAGAGAAEARRLLAARERPPTPEERPGLHGEALARRQLAEIAASRKPIDPAPPEEPADDDDVGDEQYPF
jgi:hypothetical protein